MKFWSALDEKFMRHDKELTKSIDNFSDMIAEGELFSEDKWK